MRCPPPVLATLLLGLVACSGNSPSAVTSPLAGSWTMAQAVPGSFFVMTLQADGSDVSGSGTFAAEAGPGGTSVVVGTVNGARVRLDFTLRTAFPPETRTSDAHFVGSRSGVTLQGTMQDGVASPVNLPRPVAFVRAEVTSAATGLVGTVRRGPVTPVCRVELPCDAPFAATFSVRRGARTVATFRSDASGSFVVLLPPGSYTVVPAPDAPLLDAARQVKTVEVSRGGGLLTPIDLLFDTGIR